MRILVLLYLISATFAFGIDDDPKRPPLEQCVEISLHSPYWKVRIFSNGSGSISYGALLEDHVDFPEKTFDFESVYKELIQTPAEVVSSARSVALVFRRKGSVGASSIQNSNLDSFMKFFQKAREAAPEFEKTRLPTLWTKKSPKDIDH